MAPDPDARSVVAPSLRDWRPDGSGSPAADPQRVPDGFVVLGDDGVRLHFLDWGGPADADGALLVPGLLEPAAIWAPVARRLAGRIRTVVADLRGQGLSDAPMTGYGLESLAADVVAVIEGSGLGAARRITLAGHGFGGMVAATAAGLPQLAPRIGSLVLVDGGWERLEPVTDVDVDEFLRGLDEPPEVLRSMDAYLEDRRAFDPATWDADQEQAARDAVVETAAGHVVRAVRPHVVEAMVRTMFAFDPSDVLGQVDASVRVLAAMGSGGWDERSAELRRTARARVAALRGPIALATYPDGHNLMRYRPAEVTAAILATGD